MRTLCAATVGRLRVHALPGRAAGIGHTAERNLNAYAERFVRSIKDECLEKMIFCGQAWLRRAIGEYVAHYHSERNHQGLENRLIQSDGRNRDRNGRVTRRGRLGGMLNYYSRAAA